MRVSRGEKISKRRAAQPNSRDGDEKAGMAGLGVSDGNGRKRNMDEKGMFQKTKIKGRREGEEKDWD